MPDGFSKWLYHLTVPPVISNCCMKVPISPHSSASSFIYLLWWKAYSNLLIKFKGFLIGIYVFLFLRYKSLLYIPDANPFIYIYAWRMIFNISYSARLLVMDYFNFCTSKSIFSQMTFRRMVWWTFQCIPVDVWGVLIFLSPDDSLLSSFCIFVHR